jgi:hypothetical protein
VSRTFEGETLCSLFERSAAEGGGRVALRAAGVELTWDDYAQRVRSLATRWSRVGVEPGAPVALMLAQQPRLPCRHAPVAGRTDAGALRAAVVYAREPGTGAAKGVRIRGPPPRSRLLVTRPLQRLTPMTPQTGAAQDTSASWAM